VLAKNIQQAVSLLQAQDGQACILCGGTDLIVQLRETRREANLLIDIKAIPEVNQLSYDPLEGLTIGAAVSCSRLLDDPVVTSVYPGIVDAVSLIGGIQIQNRASLGGNLCNASPAADSIPALIVHEATCLIASPDGQHQVAAENFCTGPGQTIIKKGEMLVALNLPAPRPRSAGAYLRFTPRLEMDIAVVGVAAAIAFEPDYRTIEQVRIALGAVAPRPIWVPEISHQLIGKPVSDELIQKVSLIAQQAAQPIDDMRGTARQRRHLVGILVKRALQRAVSRVAQQDSGIITDGK
jgi:CO/xanthine dehydrogenase FAD-binding subunit